LIDIWGLKMWDINSRANYYIKLEILCLWQECESRRR